MQPFSYEIAADPGEAASLAVEEGAQIIAGGTDLLQLIKEGQLSPRRLVDINQLPLRGIVAEPAGLRIGALTRMSEAAGDDKLKTGCPAIAEALLASASPQVRNMASMGGNILQRTRCLYFRDSASPCNKRQPGSGCGAMDGQNRNNALLGGSDKCIATNASDLAVALVAFDARVVILGRQGEREVALADFHRLPGDRPELESILQPGELITALIVPGSAVARQSHYLKMRDRASFEWALVSAAVGLEIEAGVVRDARIAVGGVATKPWRLPAVEKALIGAPAQAATFASAATLASEGMRPRQHNAFKVELTNRTVAQALAKTAGLA